MKRTMRIGMIAVLCLLLVACAILAVACDKQPDVQLKNQTNSVEFDYFDEESVEIDIASLLKDKYDGLTYDVSTTATEITLSEVTDGKFTVTSKGKAGSYTVNVKVNRGEEELLAFDITVKVVNTTPSLSLKNQTNSLLIELDDSDSAILSVDELIDGTIPMGTTFAVSAKGSGLSVSALNEKDFTVTATEVGKYTLEVQAKYLGKNRI